MKQHHIIYVPGILDDIYHIQSTLVKTWRLYGVHGHCHEMPWKGSEDYQPKFQRLLDEIDGYVSKGHKVSLIGASAGTSAVINAFITRPDKISGIVLICPKINGPETVSDKTYTENPAFKESLYQLQPNLKKLTAQQKSDQMRMYYSPKDGTVPYAGSTIPGIPEMKLPAIKHGRAIVYAISFGASNILSSLKNRP